MDSSLETEAVRSGLAFLFAQATDLLRRRADRRERDEDTGSDLTPDESVLEGSLDPVSIDDLSEAPLATLEELSRRARDYLDGEALSPADPASLALIEELRSALERAIGQRITFRWETERPPSGARLDAGPAGEQSAPHASGERSVAVNENSGVINTGDQAIID
ncbi:MAG TPA: hypothetical protein VFI17_07785 [Solirubrobacterales bacterium]|nr:hypothetical protein [Solirubrobacterales bacterium]